MTMETYFYVQPYKRTRVGSLERVNVLRFTSASEAEEVGASLAGHVAGVLVYAQEGDPESGAGEPEVWAKHGDVPDIVI